MLFGGSFFIKAFGLWQIAALSFYQGSLYNLNLHFLFLCWVDRKKTHQPHQPLTWQFLSTSESEGIATLQGKSSLNMFYRQDFMQIKIYR